MDNEELIQQLTESLNRCAQNAGKQSGWTAELTVLIVAVLVVGGVLLVFWFVKQHQKANESLTNQVQQLTTWQNDVVVGQLETTTKALDGVASSESNFRRELEKNTRALQGLSAAVAAAPCGKDRVAADGA